MSNKRLVFPKLGMRTVKTAICVAICLLINFLFGADIALYSSIVAIVCMQSTIENTLHTAINRIVGTAIGGGFGMLLIWLPHSTTTPPFLYVLLIPVGIIVTIYLCNMIKMPGSSVICAIVYITVIATPIIPTTVSNPYLVAVFRISDTLIGIVVAMTVNRFISPPLMYETRKVHLECGTYADVMARVADRLSRSVQLILYDSSLTCEYKPKKSEEKQPPSPERAYAVRVPVPMEYTHQKEVETAHIAADWTVTPMYLKPLDGYVEIPSETMPCTVVWQPAMKDGFVPLPPVPPGRT